MRRDLSRQAVVAAVALGCSGGSPIGKTSVVAPDTGTSDLPGAPADTADTEDTSEDPDPYGFVEDGEWLPGGETTNTRLLGSNAFLRPAQNLTAEHQLNFYGGNGFFNQGWVEAPATTEARDGLGPLFNARTCSGCHFKDGKAAPPEEGDGPFVGLLIRLSVDSEDGPIPDPVYGEQLQDQANPDIPVEALPTVTWMETSGTFVDGTPYTLVEPSFRIVSPSHGALSDDLMTSPRIAPHMIGLGLLEAIRSSQIKAQADPDDLDGDGISGRVQWHDTDAGRRIGRFGWKADAPDIDVQVANAFAGDMGLTSALVPMDDCTESQTDCMGAPDGGTPEVNETVFHRVAFYSRVIAVPVRRAADDPTVLQGKSLFHQLGCAGCHTPSYTTGDGAIPELSGQLIWPYTDLLLHDMGEGLADGRPVGEASGREWKTPPLWGLGLMHDVSGHTRYLHDGRARSLEEAVLWHAGEALDSRDAYLALGATERAAVIAFLEDL